MSEVPEVAGSSVASPVRRDSDGHLAPFLLPEHLVQGNVLRSVSRDGGQSAFSDCTILQVRDTWSRQGKTTWVKLARPYAFVSGVGTTCPSVLTGVEQFEVEASRLLGNSRYRVVLQSTGKPAEMKVGF